MQNRPWLANYPKGVPANISEIKYTTLIDFITDTLDQYKKQEAFSNFGKSLSYGELDKLSTKFGAYLQSRGLEPGEKIALMMPNVLQYPIAIIGALKAGLVVVNTNPLYTPREMEHQFTDSDAKAIVIAENFASNLEKIIDKTDIDVVITTSIGEMLGLKGGMINFVLKNVKRAVPKYNLQNVVSFKEALSSGGKFTLKKHVQNPDDVIVLQYTGGTTGVSKGAMLTNTNLLANMFQTKAWMEGYLRVSGEVVLSPLPLYHIFAFTVNCLAMMSLGAKTVLVTNPRDIKSLVKEFKTNTITTMTGVNTLFNALLNNKEFCEMNHENLRVTVGGGMAVQQVIAEKWKEVTGCVLSEGYGMTEASPVVTVNPIDGTAKMNTIGMPVPSTDVAIFNDKNEMLAVGEVGELRVKGPQVMKGYYKRPDETKNCMIDGWLCTGDMAKMTEDGFFRIVDRKKDMILVSGFNVFPNEIEDVLAMHPKVLEVAAIGIPSEKSGECVKVFVVKKEKSLKEKELTQFARENLTGYKVPKEIEFINELPKTNVGKILRRKLREL